MKRLGGFLLFFGIGSFLLNFFGYEFVIMSWIHMWGLETARLIILSMIVGGVAFIILGQIFDNKMVEAEGN